MVVLLCSCSKAFLVDDIFVPSFLFAQSDFSQPITSEEKLWRKKAHIYSVLPQHFIFFLSMIDNI